MIAAHYLLNDEKLSWAKVMGGLVAVVGASVLLLSKSTGLANLSQGWLGQGLVILASLASALGVVYTRIHLRHENVFVITAGQVFTSLLLAAPVALLIEGLPAANSYGWQGWLAVTSAAFFGPVLLYGLVFYMINQYGASLAGFAGITTPFFSLVIGLLFLGEVLTLPMAVGIVCLSVGVWSLNYF
jgi:drug/metabolite transporter (DMT)-like permease